MTADAENARRLTRDDFAHASSQGSFHTGSRH
jgi:hypothetical protein